MKKQSYSKTVEVLPDALEIKYSRLPLGIRLCVWLPFLILLCAILWASLAKIDVVAQGQGKIVTNSPTITMQPLERSVIKKVNVKIGDLVKKDQILITFDPAFNNAEAERLKNDMLTLQAQLERLKAEFSSKTYNKNNAHFEQWQTAIYNQRKAFYKERMNYYDEAILQIEASKKNREENLSKQKERLAAVQKLEDMFKGLHKKSAASLKDIIEISITRMEMEATVDQLKNDLLELNHQRGTTLAEKNSFIQEWKKSISEDMVDTDRNFTSVQKEYDKVKQLIEYVYLRSPCDAVVHEIASFSPGSAVREAEALVTLIPTGGVMEVEAEIRPEDIGKINKGDIARIKLNAYPYQRHGTLDGMVRDISENTLEKNENGMHFSYYRTRITLSGKLDKINNSFRLIPGMQAQCEIKIGRRRVIEYVLYPLIKALDETAREP